VIVVKGVVVIVVSGVVVIVARGVMVTVVKGVTVTVAGGVVVIVVDAGKQHVLVSQRTPCKILPRVFREHTIISGICLKNVFTGQ